MVAQPAQTPVGSFMRVGATIADLAQVPQDEHRYELVRGVLLRLPPPKRLHGIICMRLGARLADHCRALGQEDHVVDNAGYDFTSSEPAATVLAPDLSITQPDAAIPIEGAPYDTTPPLIAIEVVSPSETRAFMADKTAISLRGGVQQVWVIWPDTRTVDIWTSAGMHTLTEHSTLTGGAALPGFTLAVADIFPGATP
jgi:Uma2 family endonuclease